jgi:DNA-binding NtrC family response regulator
MVDRHTLSRATMQRAIATFEIAHTGHPRPAQRIVIIDDDPRDLQHMASIADTWDSAGLQIDCFQSLLEAIGHIRRTKPDLVLLDDNLAAGERAEGSLEKMRRAEYAGPVAIISGAATPGRREGLVRAGVISFVDKDELDGPGLKLLLEMAAARDRMFRPERRAAS